MPATDCPDGRSDKATSAARTKTYLPAVPDLVSVPDIFIPLFSVDAWQLGRVKTLYWEHWLVDWIEDEGEPYGGICLAAVFVGSLVVAPMEPKGHLGASLFRRCVDICAAGPPPPTGYSCHSLSASVLDFRIVRPIRPSNTFGRRLGPFS
jgi:hypothetical protein